MYKTIVLFFMFMAVFSCTSQYYEAIQKIEPNMFHKQIHDKTVQLIDVRTPEEYQQGAIENAKLINFFADDFEENVLALNKEEPVYVYCKSGNRSGKAAVILAKLGFKSIFDLKGGYKDWVNTEK